MYYVVKGMYWNAGDELFVDTKDENGEWKVVCLNDLIKNNIKPNSNVSIVINVEENKCKGCVYDLTDRVETDVEKFNVILDNCCSCKRAMKEEYKDSFADLYKAQG